MKILFVYDIYFPYGGGSQNLSLLWFKTLNLRGYDAYYLSSDFIPKEISKELTSKVLTNRTNLDLDKFLKNFHLPLILDPKNFKTLNSLKFDILQFFEPSFLGLEVLFLKNQLKSKTVFYYSTLFSHPDLKLKIWERGLLEFIRFWQNVFVLMCDGLIFPSKYIKKGLNLKNKPTTVIYPSLSEHFLSFSQEIRRTKPFDLVTVSRLTKEKNLEVLIKAMVFLKNKFKLHLIGDGKDAKYFKNLVSRLGLEKNVYFYGWIENQKLPEMLSNFDLFVFPSNHETFGLVLIEALAVGLPVVVFDYPLNHEILPKGTALFIKSLNPRVWAQTLLSLQKKPSIYLELLKQVQRKKHFLIKYHPEKAVQKLIRFYLNLINKKAI